MRILLLATTLLVATSAASLVQAAPVFRSVADEPSLQLPAGAPRVEMPAAAPAPVATPATTAAQPFAAPTALPVSRAGEVIDSVGSGAIPALSLEATTENGITYVSGGISDEEVEQLKSNENTFNLRLQITGLHAEYVSDVNVVLKDAGGKALVSVSDAGPYLYFQVPAGSYSADVSAHGTTKTLALKVEEGKAVKQQVRI